MKRLLFILILLLGWTLQAQLSHSSSGWQPYGGASVTFTNSLTNGVVECWHFDETADGSKATGCVAGIVLEDVNTVPRTSGLVSNGLNIVADSKYLYSSDARLKATNATFVCWVYPTTSNSVNRTVLVSTSDDYSKAGFGIYLSHSSLNAGKITLVLLTNETTLVGVLKTTSFVTLNTWQMLTFVSDYTAMQSRLYLNNSLIGTTNIVFGYSTNRFKVGEVGVSQNPQSRIDELIVYNRALTFTEIESLYNCRAKTTTPIPITYPFQPLTPDVVMVGTNAASASVTFTNSLTNGLVAYWNFNEASGNAADSLGTYTLTNVGSTAFTSGLINNGITNNQSVGKYFENGSTDLMITNFSVSVWYAPSELGVESQSIVSRDSLTGDRSWWLGYSITGPSWAAVIGTNSGNSSVAVLRWTNTVSHLYSFHHVVLVKSNLSAYLYIDGVIKTSTVLSGYKDTSIPFRVGARDSGNEIMMKGICDELAFYNRALTPTEIESLYNRRSKTTTPVPLGYPFMPLTPDVVTVGTNAPNVNSVALTNSLTNGVVSYWACADATDALGTNTLGTSGSISYAAALIGNGLSNNGSGNYFTLSSNVVNIKPMSLSFWVKPNTAVNQKIIEQWQLTSGGYRFRFIQGSSSTWTMNYSTDGVNVSGGTSGALAFGVWTHFLFTVNTSEMKIYTNGVLAATISASLVAAANTDFDIGRTLNGLVDEVGLWDKVLTEKEAEAIYNRGAKTTGPIPLAYPFGAFVRP